MRTRTAAALVAVVALGVAGGVFLGFATAPPRGITAGSAARATAHDTGAPSPPSPSSPAGPAARNSASPAPGSASATPTPEQSPSLSPPPALSPTPAHSPTPAPSAVALATLPPPRPGEVPILYYHRVEAPPRDFASWSLSSRRGFLETDVLPEAFDAQLGWLAAHGYTTILPRDLAAHWDQGTKLPARPVILTFDDGTPDWIDAVLPLLRKHGMVAEFYVAIGHVGRELSWDDLRALMKAGNGIGAHDINHTQLTATGTGWVASPQRMWAEVKGARNIIRTNLGVAPDSMAYVGGGYDATLMDLVRKAGYTTARSIDRGVIQTPEVRYRLRAVRIGAYDDVRSVLNHTLVRGLPTFEKRVTGVDPG